MALPQNADGTAGSVDPIGTWYQGWGFMFQSPDGSVNHATATRPAGWSPQATSATPLPTQPGGLPVDTSVTDSSATALINGALGQFGLTSLSQWAWSKYKNGEGIDQIMLELPQTTEFKTRFPAYQKLADEGRAISPAQYVNYEQSAFQMANAAGLDGQHFTNDDVTKLLENDVALPELQQRISGAQTAAFSAPPEVRTELQRLYGVSPGELTSFWIDPDRALPLIQQRFAAAQAAGVSDITGFGGLTQAQAEMVGNLGLTQGQLSQQFGQIAAQNELFNPLVGNAGTGIGKDVALGAEFNQDAGDQAIIDQQKRARLSPFAGGGAVATNQQGALGAGSAR